MNQLTRIEAYRRFGCWSNADYVNALLKIERQWVSYFQPSSPYYAARPMGERELEETHRDAIALVESKDAEALARETHHTHDTDVSAVEAFAGRATGSPQEPPDGAQEPPESGSRLLGLCLSDVTLQRTHYLWDGLLVDSALNVCGGHAGVGKSTFLAWLMASVTNGTLEGEHKGKQRTVIIVNSEDTLSDTIAPRLVAAGADLGRVFVTTIKGNDLAAPEFPRDYADLEELIKEHKAALVVFDPISGRLGKEVDTHNNAQVREALEPLVRLAQKHEVCVLGTMHPNKSRNSNSNHALGASAAFIELPRAVVQIHIDPDDPTGERRVIGLSKGNTVKNAGEMLAFTIENVVVGTDARDNTPVGGNRLVWVDSVAGTIQGLYDRAAEPKTIKTDNGPEPIDVALKMLLSTADELTLDWTIARDALVKADLLTPQGDREYAPFDDASLKKVKRALAKSDGLVRFAKRGRVATLVYQRHLEP